MTDHDNGSLREQDARSVPGELVARLEVASAGSMELDCDISIALGEWSPPAGGVRIAADRWRRRDLNHYHPHTPVTTSLDAALALAERVLPGARCMTERFFDGSGWAMVQTATGRPRIMTDAATPALALCAAILKATTAGAVGMEAPSGRNAPDKARSSEGGAT